MLDEWFVMHPALVGIYTSALAEDFATVDKLQPTTDQEDAYEVTNNWTAERIANALLRSRWSRSLSPLELPETHDLDPGELAETLGFLALELVVPADLHSACCEDYRHPGALQRGVLCVRSGC